eukprot:4346143-Prymnesium_polylepis.1
MKKVIGRVVSRENTGFSPGRFISENTQQMKLMQAMLEENNEPGMFVFLDLEKAFDRVSWDTMFGSSVEIHKSRRAFPQVVGLKKGSFPAESTSAIAFSTRKLGLA